MIDPQILVKAIQTVKPALSRYSPPILLGIRLHQNSRLTFEATDQTLWLRTSIEHQGEDYDVVVPDGIAERLFKDTGGYVSIRYGSFPRNRFEHKPEELTGLIVKSSTGTQPLVGMDATEFPDWPACKEPKTITVDRQTLTKALNKVLPAASSDESRFNLDTVFFDGPQQALVASDGHRLMKQTADWLPSDVALLLPKKAVAGLVKAFEKSLGKKGDTEVEIRFTKRHMFFEWSNCQAAIKIKDGAYPDYQHRVMDHAEAAKSEPILYDRAELLHALRLVKIMTSSRNKSIGLSHDCGTTEFTSVHPDLGTARHRIDTQDWETRIPFYIDVDYMMQAVRKADKIVSVCFPTESGAPLFVGDELIMPMRK